MNDEQKPRYGYLAFYKGKQMEVYANTSLEAQEIAAKAFRAKKTWEVCVYLCEKDGETVMHSTGEL